MGTPSKVSLILANSTCMYGFGLWDADMGNVPEQRLATRGTYFVNMFRALGDPRGIRGSGKDCLDSHNRAV